MPYDFDFFDDDDTSDTVTVSAAPEDPCITYEELQYLVKLAKKDSKLSAILRKLMEGVELELPF